MNVKQLIKKLQTLPPAAPVLVAFSRDGLGGLENVRGISPNGDAVQLSADSLYKDQVAPLAIGLADHEENIATLANLVGHNWAEIYEAAGHDNGSIGVMCLAIDWAKEFAPIQAQLEKEGRIDEWIETIDDFGSKKIEELIEAAPKTPFPAAKVQAQIEEKERLQLEGEDDPESYNAGFVDGELYQLRQWQKSFGGLKA